MERRSAISTGDLSTIKPGIVIIFYLPPTYILNLLYFSVNYDFEEPEFDNITSEAKVSK